jgi:BRCT domain type II-containing protein
VKLASRRFRRPLPSLSAEGLSLVEGYDLNPNRRFLRQSPPLADRPGEEPRACGPWLCNGRSVCFTDASVVAIRGLELTRDDQESLAREAGMVVKAGVSRKLDILVLADPDSRSGKAKTADELGVRKMAEPVFWRALGIDID